MLIKKLFTTIASALCVAPHHYKPVSQLKARMGARVDLVIFGATGFTGQIAVRQMLKLEKEFSITWAVAGRNPLKLEEILKVISTDTGEALERIPVMIADVKDPKSLSEMAAKAKVVVNCVGPYWFYGEPVVKACVENGAHHVDVSGEPQYMEQMQLEYNEEAKRNGTYIVNACGLSGIPADLGLIYLIQHFNGDLNSVESYIEWEYTGKSQCALIHYGTWESAIHSLKNQGNLKPIRIKLFSQKLPVPNPKLLPRPVLHKSKVIDKWCLPFPAADRSVMYHSQRYLYEQDGTRPVQAATYIGFSSLVQALLTALFACIFAIMTKTTFTCNQLLKHPRLFSAGFVSRECLTKEAMVNTEFKITFYGEGWTDRKTVAKDHDTPPNKTMVIQVKGRDPGYGFTTSALLLAAITILKEADKMPGSGGVFPPGAAFAKTSLISQLSAHGLSFEIIKEEVKIDSR